MLVKIFYIKIHEREILKVNKFFNMKNLFSIKAFRFIKNNILELKNKYLYRQLCQIFIL